MIEGELETLVQKRILESISHSDSSVTIVSVLKADFKSVRIYGDFKYVNQQLHCERYPVPGIEELLSVVGKAKIFT